MGRHWKYVWHWRCTWENNYGCFHPDYECCGAHSRRGFGSKERALAAAMKHMRAESHSVQVWSERKYEDV